MTKRKIVIEVKGGVVIDVRGLPKGWTYDLIDHDVEANPSSGKIMGTDLFLVEWKFVYGHISPEEGEFITDNFTQSDSDHSFMIDSETLDDKENSPTLREQMREKHPEMLQAIEKALQDGTISVAFG